MKRKRNGFLTFVVSFMPGAAEMYMGFMKCGFSLMLLFLATAYCALGNIIDGGLGFLMAVLVWFFAFFHARNLSACDEAALQTVEDDFIWNSFLGEETARKAVPAVRKWSALILIVIGVGLLWKNLYSMFANLIPEHLWDMLWPIVSRVPQIAIAFIVIAIGVSLMIGKKKELKDGE